MSVKQRNGYQIEHFDRIILYYAEWQESYRSEFKSGGGQTVEFREGLPQSTDFQGDNRKHTLIILDDLQREAASNSTTVVDLFTRGCHHRNISVIFITQNLFHKGGHQREISLNTSYLVVLRNVRDRSQFSFVARQIAPHDPKFLQKAYFDACSKAHGYLLLDLTQETPEDLRFRTNIFPDDEVHYAYVPKNVSKFSV